MATVCQYDNLVVLAESENKWKNGQNAGYNKISQSGRLAVMNSTLHYMKCEMYNRAMSVRKYYSPWSQPHILYFVSPSVSLFLVLSTVPLSVHWCGCGLPPSPSWLSTPALHPPCYPCPLSAASVPFSLPPHHPLISLVCISVQFSALSLLSHLLSLALCVFRVISNK